MSDRIATLAGVQILDCAPDGPKVETEKDATGLIGAAYGGGAAWVVLPAERLTDSFFQLGTLVAGNILQKFATYQIGIAIVGDISAHVERSKPLRDFVFESNKGRQVWFVEDRGALGERLEKIR